MWSSNYYVTLYRNTLRMKRGSDKSEKFSDMFTRTNYMLFEPYKTMDKSVIIKKEQSDSDEEYMIFCQLNSIYRAMIKFQRDKGFDSPKYKGKLI